MSAWKTGSIGFKVTSDAIQTQSVSVPSTAMYDMCIHVNVHVYMYMFVFVFLR